MSKTSISHLDNEHNDWLRALDFYKTELGILKGRLTEVAGKNTADEVALNAEHFENQIKIQIANVDTLRHNINENLQKVSLQAKENAAHIDKELITQHENLREQYISEEKTINELRHEFNRFASKWM
ncbi:MAG: hypothetical protein R2800_15575 [Flavipsychrobacter sp.]